MVQTNLLVTGGASAPILCITDTGVIPKAG